MSPTPLSASDISMQQKNEEQKRIVAKIEELLPLCERLK